MPRLKYPIVLSLVFLLLFSTRAQACTPMVGVIYTAFGASAWAAFAFKSLIGIFLIVLLKTVLFSRFSGLRLGESFRCVFVANIFSTIPGFLAIPIIGIVEIFISFPLQILVCLVPAKRIAQHIKLSPRFVVILLLGCLYISNALFASISPSQGAFRNLLIEYWPYKIVAAFFAVIFGLAVTTGFEEAIIHELRKCDKDETNYLKPVVRANAYAMLVAVAIAAAVAIPQRLHTENFLLYGLKAIYHMITSVC